MFKRINGVLIQEYFETKEQSSIFDKRFELKYYDSEFFRKLVKIDFLHMFVEGYGDQWMFVIKETDYEENKLMYTNLVISIHKKIGNYLERKYGYSNPDGWVLVESAENVNA